MKLFVLPMITLLLLSACKTAPKPVPVIQVCPKVPALELDVPDRDWLGSMQNFLRGTVVMPVDYSLHSTPARLPTLPSEKQ